MKTSLRQQKRDYLGRVVTQLLASGRYKFQKEVATLLGETEQSLSSKLAGDRGLKDDFIDTVAEKSGIPFQSEAPDVNLDAIKEEVAELSKSIKTLVHLSVAGNDKLIKVEQELADLKAKA